MQDDILNLKITDHDTKSQIEEKIDTYQTMRSIIGMFYAQRYEMSGTQFSNLPIEQQNKLCKKWYHDRKEKHQ